jgi:hypothetical protein
MVNAAKALAEVDKDDRQKEWEKEQAESEGLEGNVTVSPSTGSTRPKRANAGKRRVLDE